LKSIDCLIELKFLPPNCTPLLQSVVQSIIQFGKAHYKKSLLCSVISRNDIIECPKWTNLKDVVFNLAYAWQNVPPKTIISWKEMWPHIHYPVVAVKSQGQKNRKMMVQS
jgi:hypothetical protein